MNLPPAQTLWDGRPGADEFRRREALGKAVSALGQPDEVN